jgi:hypothetical protein
LASDNSLVRQRLYKYFSDRKWAEAFLDGQIRFRSLAYFRDYEDEGIRKDKNEGTAIFRPDNGLEINNLTQGTKFILPGYAFESSANQEEIFVYCTSRVLNDEIRAGLNANTCVEILRIQTFCTRIRNALPATATFRWGRLAYYEETEGGSPRWALPDMIALSKLKDYEWQHEYRFIFCLSDALGFEKGTQRLVRGQIEELPKPAEHRFYDVRVRALRDICQLHQF